MSFRISIGVLLAAISLGAAATEQETRNLVALGALSFADNCIKCHQVDGYGEEALYPSLRDPELLANKPLLISTILHGRTGKQTDGSEERLMPSLDFLTNREITAIIAFISNSWGDGVLLVTEDDINKAR
ncbi:c-type cytochrome [Microbulbifer pacificus]|uniref:Cytochrome c n=1 Tax=Microbulbifer pacificus TaxID=407164 RepID=A0AAU0MWI3_9GAMM|nr:cytochrome c [Microbulbifer pacificus]WOX04145.1 cytochrome c [Microbulbifer pacificus]